MVLSPSGRHHTSLCLGIFSFSNAGMASIVQPANLLFGCLPGPGVLVGTAITAVLVKGTFPYDWSWIECLLFGAMFSATDPVAVVAVLKEVSNDHLHLNT